MDIVNLISLFASELNAACALLEVHAPDDPVFVFANHAFCTLTGFSISELKGRPFSLLFHQAEHPLAVRRLQAALRAGTDFRNIRMGTHKNGKLYTAQLVGRPIHDKQGGITHILMFERLMRRRRGRPPVNGDRYEPAGPEAEAIERFFQFTRYCTQAEPLEFPQAILASIPEDEC